MSPYFSCHGCLKIITDQIIDYSDMSIPSPCCGNRTNGRGVWPPFGFKGGTQMVFGLDLSTDESTRTACVFLGALLEGLTEETLWTLLSKLNTPRAVANTLMGRLSGRSALLDVYKGITGSPARDVFKSHGSEPWFNDWEELAKARNDLAHGAWKTRRTAKPLPTLVGDVRAGALDAMAILRNAGLDAI